MSGKLHWQVEGKTLGAADVAGGLLTIPPIRLDFPREHRTRWLFMGLHLDFIASGHLDCELVLLRDGAEATKYLFEITATSDTTVLQPTRWTFERCPFQFTALAEWSMTSTNVTGEYAETTWIDPDVRTAPDGHQECFDYQFPDNTGATAGRKAIVMTMFPLECPGDFDGAILKFNRGPRAVDLTPQTINSVVWAFARAVFGVRQLT